MRKLFAVIGFLALLAPGATTSLAAQAPSVVSRAELEAAVAESPKARAATGAVSADSLAVSPSDGTTRATERDLAGGNTVVISTTAIIIALLILILVT